MRIWSVSVITLSMIAIPLARSRGQEAAPTLSVPSFLPDGGGATLAGWHTLEQAGAGSDILAVDLNGDGRMDIVTSTRSGTYIFWGKPNPAGKAR